MTVEPERLSAIDALTWSIEHDPKLRAPITALVTLDGPVERSQLRHIVERASRVVPRMRHRVVADPTGIAPPTWEVDPDFVLAYHLRHTDLGGQGLSRDLLDLAAPIVMLPFNRARPLWEITQVDGLADSRSALVLKTHHAITDGIGAVRMMLELFDLQLEPTPGRDVLPPVPEYVERTTEERIQAAIAHEARSAWTTLQKMTESLGEASGDLMSGMQRLSETVDSIGRMMRPPREPTSELLSSRSLELRLDQFALPLDDLRNAGERIGGSINDAFVAGTLLGMGEYHRAMGSGAKSLRVSIPMSTRPSDDDAMAGNNWTPALAELPIDITDADELMRRVRGEVIRLRHEPANQLAPIMSGVLRRLPSPAASAIFGAATQGVDIAASNVPGSPVPLFIGGRRVESLMPFGPLVGSAANITMLSHTDTANIGVVHDCAAVTDGPGLTKHLLAGFEQIHSG